MLEIAEITVLFPESVGPIKFTVEPAVTDKVKLFKAAGRVCWIGIVDQVKVDSTLQRAYVFCEGREWVYAGSLG